MVVHLEAGSFGSRSHYRICSDNRRLLGVKILAVASAMNAITGRRDEVERESLLPGTPGVTEARNAAANWYEKRNVNVVIRVLMRETIRYIGDFCVQT